MFDIQSIGAFLKKNLTRTDVLISLALVVLYFVSRIVRLDSFPIFTDEGIYIRWAKVAQADPNWRFISLTDGKQPLHIWGMIPFLKIFSNNLLLGGRSFSVLSGFVGMLGMGATASYLFRRKQAAYIAMLLYVLTPMFLFYDRLALADSAVTAGALWILFGSLVLVRTLRLDVALIYGLSAGIVLLTKSSSRMFLGLAALAPILQIGIKQRKTFLIRALNYYVLWSIALVLALSIYNIQRLSPFMYMIAEKNKTFVLTFGEFLHNPLELFWGNVHLIPWYVASEMGYVAAVLGVVGLVQFIRRDWRQGLYISLWIILPYFAITAFAKVLFPRYVIFIAAYLTLGATYFFLQSKNKVILTTATVFFLATALYGTYTIIFDPAHIPLPPVDHGQYIGSQNAGWGIKDIIQYARERSVQDGKPVKFVAEGNFGVVGDMLEASMNRGDTNLSVSGYWPLGEEQLKSEQKALKDHTVLVVFSHRQSPQDVPGIWPIKLIKVYTKPSGHDPYLLYELTP